MFTHKLNCVLVYIQKSKFCGKKMLDDWPSEWMKKEGAITSL